MACPAQSPPSAPPAPPASPRRQVAKGHTDRWSSPSRSSTTPSRLPRSPFLPCRSGGGPRTEHRGGPPPFASFHPPVSSGDPAAAPPAVPLPVQHHCRHRRGGNRVRSTHCSLAGVISLDKTLLPPLLWDRHSSLPVAAAHKKKTDNRRDGSCSSCGGGRAPPTSTRAPDGGLLPTPAGWATPSPVSDERGTRGGSVVARVGKDAADRAGVGLNCCSTHGTWQGDAVALGWALNLLAVNPRVRGKAEIVRQTSSGRRGPSARGEGARRGVRAPVRKYGVSIP